MLVKVKRILVKITLFLLKGLAKLKKPLIFLLKILKPPIELIGKILFNILLPIYKTYVFLKRSIVRFLFPSKDLRSIVTNKYIVHAAVVVIAVATATQSIYAYSNALGDYGKKSILYKLSNPVDEDEMVEGIPIHSDIEGPEGQTVATEITFTSDFKIESNNTAGYIGSNYAPTLETERTRTNIEYYIVQTGDTLGGISEKFGLSLTTLLWANNLTERSYIRPGDKLTILPVSGISHTVAKGETLSSIAKKYKVEASEIIEFNKLADSSNISVGQVLVVPGGKKEVYVAPSQTYSSGYTSKTYTSSGTLLWPAPTRRITQYFSWNHPAVDVGIPVGSRLVAAESGTVIYAGWGTGYGNEVLIDHGSGFKTRYAHGSRILVKVGDTVDRGQLVMLSGNTGWSTGPHLHFEVYVNGVRRNPLLYTK